MQRETRAGRTHQGGSYAAVTRASPAGTTRLAPRHRLHRPLSSRADSGAASPTSPPAATARTRAKARASPCSLAVREAAAGEGQAVALATISYRLIHGFPTPIPFTRRIHGGRRGSSCCCWRRRCSLWGRQRRHEWQQQHRPCPGLWGPGSESAPGTERTGVRAYLSHLWPL